MSTSPNEFFDQIYLINLTRQPEKLTKVLWRLAQPKLNFHPIKVMEAIDGYHPSTYSIQSDIPAGAYGYLLTWKKIIDDAIYHNYDRILILDDDVIPHKNFPQLFSNTIHNLRLSELPPIWLLGASQHVPISKQYSITYPAHITDGSFATAILTNPTLHLIREKLADPIPQYVDSDMLRYFYNDHPDTKNRCLVSIPNLMIADVRSSDIRKPRDPIALAKKLNWDLENHYHTISTWDVKPIVSIIIPVYNAEFTIERCLESLLDQTYRPLHLVIINDGSTDKTPILIGQLLHHLQYDPRLHGLHWDYFSHPSNLGCYTARNTGLDIILSQTTSTPTDFIGFQDADDISLPTRIEDQLNLQLATGVKCTTCLILRTHLNHLSKDAIILEADIKKSRIHPHPKWCCRAKVGLVTTLFPIKVVKRLGHFKTNKPWGQDDDYIRRLFPELRQAHATKMMNFLDTNRWIPKRHATYPKVLYLSHEMTPQNLTNQRKLTELTSP